MPAFHNHLQFGQTLIGNFRNWSYPGLGGTNTTGGQSGQSGTYVVETFGNKHILQIGQVSIFSEYDGLTNEAQNGFYLHGGNGADGLEGGGGKFRFIDSNH